MCRGLECELQPSLKDPDRVPRFSVRADHVDGHPGRIRWVPVERERDVGELAAGNILVVQVDVREPSRNLERSQASRAVAHLTLGSNPADRPQALGIGPCFTGESVASRDVVRVEDGRFQHGSLHAYDRVLALKRERAVEVGALGERGVDALAKNGARIDEERCEMRFGALGVVDRLVRPAARIVDAEVKPPVVLAESRLVGYIAAARMDYLVPFLRVDPGGIS